MRLLAKLYITDNTNKRNSEQYISVTAVSIICKNSGHVVHDLACYIAELCNHCLKHSGARQQNKMKIQIAISQPILQIAFQAKTLHFRIKLFFVSITLCVPSKATNSDIEYFSCGTHCSLKTHAQLIPPATHLVIRRTLHLCKCEFFSLLGRYMRCM